MNETYVEIAFMLLLL